MSDEASVLSDVAVGSSLSETLTAAASSHAENMNQDDSSSKMSIQVEESNQGVWVNFSYFE